MPSRNRRRIITLLQERHKPYTGRFQGVVSCTIPGILCSPAPSGRLPVGHGSTVAAIPRPGNPPIFRRKFERFLSWNFFSDFSPVIVANNSRLKVAAKVAEQTPESRKTSGGIFIVAIVAGSKSLAYFASSASMILSASAPYTSSRYFRRSSSGSLGSPRGFSGRRTTSCWSV